MIEVKNLRKVFGTGDAATTVLDDITFDVAGGEIFAVVGPSGAGKSTLSRCLNLLEEPTSGDVVVNGENLAHLGSAGLRVARRRIGTVFQSSNLLTRRTAAQNVALPLEYLGATKESSRRRVSELLDRVGLADRADHYPHQLSGGQRQRVGIARALALRPSVLLSDEATSGLDPAATASYLRLLTDLRTELGLAVVLITHEMDAVTQVADRVGRLDAGRLVEQGTVLQLALDPSSTLGAALRRDGETARAGETADAVVSADAERTTVTVVYSSQRVPDDWLARLSVRLGRPLGLLGADIRTVDGAAFGHATVSVPLDVVREFGRAAAELGLTPAESAAPDPTSADRSVAVREVVPA
ncbi:MAG: ATP-binding cassette domain-containing protein [Gordonia sp. (in: high G+C Gram-positive bacteria)]